MILNYSMIFIKLKYITNKTHILHGILNHAYNDFCIAKDKIVLVVWYWTLGTANKLKTIVQIDISKCVA